MQRLNEQLATQKGIHVASLTGIIGIGIAVVFHDGSTIGVVLNALRLLGYRRPKV